MPRRAGLTRSVQAFVQSEVVSVLGTYRNALDRAASLIAQARANVDRRRNELVAARTAHPFAEHKERARRHGNGDEARLRVGQVVSYRQGAGTFEARVVELGPTGRVMIERRADGKRLTRPASKLIVS